MEALAKLPKTTDATERDPLKCSENGQFLIWRNALRRVYRSFARGSIKSSPRLYCPNPDQQKKPWPVLCFLRFSLANANLIKKVLLCIGIVGFVIVCPNAGFRPNQLTDERRGNHIEGDILGKIHNHLEPLAK
jgi:hypothetical protein